MPHKFQYTLDLLRTVIHSMPAVFPQDRHQEMDGKLTDLEKNPNATQEQIEAFIVIFGKEIWPYKEAYEAFYKIYGEAKEREAMRAKLAEPARVAFDQFVGEGGKVEDVRNGSKFEIMFNADLKEEIIKAELDSHDEVHNEMEKLIGGEKAQEFAALLVDHRQKLAKIAEKIGELKKLAERDPMRAAEILDRAKTFEQGFAYVERTPLVDDVAREIQYYVDVMENVE
jgi:hypothetical protein